MADPQARTGIEFEFQSIRVLFAKANGTPCPSTTEFPTKDYPLCYPVRYTDLNFLTNTGSTNWQGQWGFRVVYDSPSQDTLNGQNTRSAILELNTSAALVSDYDFWLATRAAIKAFDEVALSLETTTERSALVDNSNNGNNKWITLEEFLKRYNAKVDNIDLAPALRDRFKLELSPTAYAKAYKVPEAERYTPFVRYSNRSMRDVQLSYEMDLKCIDRSLDAWVNMWKSLWWRYPSVASGVPSMIDSDMGVQEQCSENHVVRNQILAALWKQAHAQALIIVPNALIADPDQRSLVRGLVTYLLVGGAVRLPQGDVLLKNSFSQLPKTSPASIGKLIKDQYGATLAATLTGLGNDTTATNAYNFIVNTMRNLPQLVANGYLPAYGPYPVAQNPDVIYSTPSAISNIVAPPAAPVAATERANFIALWKMSLNYDAAVPGAALTDANRMGYSAAAPFYCSWAGDVGDVKSSFPAKPLIPGQNGNIRICFESRTHFNMINVGFSPRSMPCMARRSYFRLYDTFVGGAHPAPMDQAFNRLYPDNPQIVQRIQLAPGQRQYTH